MLGDNAKFSVCVGGKTNFSVCVGGKANTNMLVLPTQIFALGGLPNAKC